MVGNKYLANIVCRRARISRSNENNEQKDELFAFLVLRSIFPMKIYLEEPNSSLSGASAGRLYFSKDKPRDANRAAKLQVRESLDYL